MPKGNRLSVDAAAKKIVAIVEKGLAKFPRQERDARLERIHEIASSADGARRKDSTRSAQRKTFEVAEEKEVS
jgi:hypothetical protein